MGFAWFVGADGAKSPRAALGGRPVTTDATGALVASTDPYSGASGIGILRDADEHVVDEGVLR